MSPQFLQILVCPACHSSLRLAQESAEGGEILAGELRCTSCARVFPIRGGIPRFTSGESYVSSFGFEWKRWQRTQFDTESRNTSEATFISSTGIEPRELAGKLVLEAGCGAGRYMDVAARAGAEVVGVDLSLAVEVARENLRAFPRCHFAQADLLQLPFAPRTFNFIYSIGVLHHTPDTHAAFKQLLPLLAPGGMVAIWVYPRRRLAEAFRYFPQNTASILEQDYHFAMTPRRLQFMRRYARLLDFLMEGSSDFERRFTTRMPRTWLYALCRAAVPLYYLYRLPPFYPLRLITKIAMDPNPEWRALDTFDWYSPRFQWKHTFGEVREWFEEAGLENIKVLPRLVAVSGKRT